MFPPINGDCTEEVKGDCRELEGIEVKDLCNNSSRFLGWLGVSLCKGLKCCAREFEKLFLSILEGLVLGLVSAEVYLDPWKMELKA